MREILLENGLGGISGDLIALFFKLGLPWEDYETPHREYFKGLAWWDYFERRFCGALSSLGETHVNASSLFSRFREKCLDISEWRLYEDTLETLHTARKSYRCHVASNNVPEFPTLLKNLGLIGYFDRIFNSAEIGYEKPHYGFFGSVLLTLASLPETYVMVGDNFIADVMGARSSGIKAILVRSPNHFGYKYSCRELREIFDVLESLSE